VANFNFYGGWRYMMFLGEGFIGCLRYLHRKRDILSVSERDVYCYMLVALARDCCERSGLFVSDSNLEAVMGMRDYYFVRKQLGVEELCRVVGGYGGFLEYWMGGGDLSEYMGGDCKSERVFRDDLMKKRSNGAKKLRKRRRK
jgi:hypothetical protein